MACVVAEAKVRYFPNMGLDGSVVFNVAIPSWPVNVVRGAGCSDYFCDVCLALYYALGFAFLPGILVWAFFLPSQILLAVSPIRCDRSKKPLTVRFRSPSVSAK